MTAQSQAIFRLRTSVIASTARYEQNRSAARLMGRALPGGSLVNYTGLFVAALFGIGGVPNSIEFVRDWLSTGQSAVPIWAALIPVVVLPSLTCWVLNRLRERYSSKTSFQERGIGPRGIRWGDQFVRASSLGIGVRRERIWSVYAWAAFKSIEQKSDHLNLAGHTDIKVIIPHAAFANAAQIDEFRQFANAQIGQRSVAT